MQTQIQTQTKLNREVGSIGDIGLTRAETTLYFNTSSVPSKVVDGDDNLLCFYAKEVMAESSHKYDDAKENKLHNISTRSTSSGGLPKQEDYWYFFSPLYFGESPVACITSPQMCEGNTMIPIFTFKRMYDGQPLANDVGYFGGEMKYYESIVYYLCQLTIRSNELH
jgi:hypothetical protein